MANLLEAILQIVEAEESAITIRHLFYRLVGLGIIKKPSAPTSCYVIIWRGGAKMVNSAGIISAIQRAGISPRRCSTVLRTRSTGQEKVTGATSGQHNPVTVRSGLRNIPLPV
jgi:hypothetical protein